MRDPYEVLGVAEHASMDEVTAAYRRLVLEWHPDRHVGAGPRRHALAEMRMAEISGAYRVLLDPSRVGADFDYRRAAPVEFEVSDS